MATNTADVLQGLPAPAACPVCGYSRVGLEVKTACPECGHVLSDEDAKHAYRWDMFLGMTWWTALRRWAVLAAAAAAIVTLREWGREIGPMTLLVAAIASMSMSLVSALFVPARGLRGRVLRRCWVLSAVYAQLFWLLPIGAYVLGPRSQQLFFGLWASDYTPESLSMTLAVSGFFGVTVAMFAFKRSLVFVRVTLSERERRALVEGLKLGAAPHGLAALAAGIMGVVTLLDRLRPTWWW